MIAINWNMLILQTLARPAEAAKALIGLRLAPMALWTALLLVAVLNAFLFALSGVLLPPPPEFAAMLPSPFFFLLIVTITLVLSVVAVHRAGRIIGGAGTLEDILVLVVWLQALRLGVQVLALVLALAVPPLSALVVFAALFYGIFIMLHFINQAHGFGSLLRAAGVLIVSALVGLLAVSLLLSLVGSSILEAPVHV